MTRPWLLTIFYDARSKIWPASCVCAKIPPYDRVVEWSSFNFSTITVALISLPLGLNSNVGQHTSLLAGSAFGAAGSSGSGESLLSRRSRGRAVSAAATSTNNNQALPPTPLLQVGHRLSICSKFRRLLTKVDACSVVSRLRKQSSCLKLQCFLIISALFLNSQSGELPISSRWSKTLAHKFPKDVNQ